MNSFDYTFEEQKTCITIDIPVDNIKLILDNGNKIEFDLKSSSKLNLNALYNIVKQNSDCAQLCIDSSTKVKLTKTLDNETLDDAVIFSISQSKILLELNSFVDRVRLSFKGLNLLEEYEDKLRITLANSDKDISIRELIGLYNMTFNKKTNKQNKEQIYIGGNIVGVICIDRDIDFLMITLK